MKKIILSISFLSIVGISLLSCEKEIVLKSKVDSESNELSIKKETPPIDNSNYSQLEIKNNTLSFSSIQYYESFLDNSTSPKTDFLIQKIDDLKFNSLKNQLDLNNKSKKSNYDDFLTSILDENQIVKIGKWFIKVNLATGKVFASSEDNKNAYDLVLKEEQTNKNVYTFTTDDEVLVILSDETLLNEKAWFKRCKDRKANKKSKESNIVTISSVNGTPIKMMLESKYVKGGIYFALKSEGRYTNHYATNNLVGFWFQLENCSYKKRCHSYISNYSHPWRNATSSSGGSNSLDLIKKFKWYSGVRQLKNYDYKVRLRCEHTIVVLPNYSYTTIFTDWVHILDN